jgi:hypothetical protein
MERNSEWDFLAAEQSPNQDARTKTWLENRCRPAAGSTNRWHRHAPGSRTETGGGELQPLTARRPAAYSVRVWALTRSRPSKAKANQESWTQYQAGDRRFPGENESTGTDQKTQRRRETKIKRRQEICCLD